MPERVDPAAVIASALGGFVVRGRSYPGDLPEELAPWYCYLPDSGHSVVIVTAQAPHAGDRWPGPGDVVPAPVKAVLRQGWTVTDEGYIRCDLPYDDDLGLVTEPGDSEYNGGSNGGSNGADAPLYALAVGSLYNPARTSWPEAALWRLSENGVQLVIFYATPNEQEIDDVRKGEARFALLAGEHALILAHKLGDSPWSDSPWQACRQTDAVAGLPEVGDGQHLLVTVVLVDATTGIVRALRTTSWSPQFTAAVRKAIRTQLLNSSTEAQGAAEIDRWYARYTDTRALVRAADLTTRGGTP